MPYNFKIIPTPIFRNKFLNKKSSNTQIAEMLENIMNEETRLGWEFVDIKTIMVPIKKSFFNSKIFLRRIFENDLKIKLSPSHLSKALFFSSIDNFL